MYKPTPSKRTARTMFWLCGSLFSIFSFLYLYVMQADLMTVSQHLLSMGQTAYSPLWGALVITGVLLFLQGLMHRLIVYPMRFQALYLFPSCLVLGLLTSIVPQSGWEVQLSTSWGVVLAGVFIYILVTWFSLHYPDTKNRRPSFISGLWVNLLILSLQCCMTIAVSNTNDIYHYRIHAERLVSQGQDSLALTIGQRSLQTDSELAAVRAFALSRTGQMGEFLFTYPQYNGSNGLLPLITDTVDVFGWKKALYRHLGGRPGRTIRNAAHYLNSLSLYPSATDATYDYRLCACLLDKNLNHFVSLLANRQAMIADSIPRHYREALVLYSNLKPNTVTYQDSVMECTFQEFKTHAGQFESPTERANQSRRKYGDTYWWYYFYQVPSKTD